MSLDFQRFDLRDEDWEGVKKIVQTQFFHCEKILFNIAKWMKDQRLEDKFGELLRMNGDMGRRVSEAEKTARERHEIFAESTNSQLTGLIKAIEVSNNKIKELEERIALGLPLHLIEDVSPQSITDETFNKQFCNNQSNIDNNDPKGIIRISNTKAIWQLANKAIKDNVISSILTKLATRFEENLLKHASESAKLTVRLKKSDELFSSIKQELRLISGDGSFKDKIMSEFSHLSTRLAETNQQLIDQEGFNFQRFIQLDEIIATNNQILIDDVKQQADRHLEQQQAIQSQLEEAKLSFSQQFEEVKQSADDRQKDFTSTIQRINHSLEQTKESLQEVFSSVRQEQSSAFETSNAHQANAIAEAKEQFQILRLRTEEQMQTLCHGIDDLYPRIKRVRLDLASTNRWIKDIISLSDQTFTNSLKTKVIEFTTNVWMKTEKMKEVIDIIKENIISASVSKRIDNIQPSSYRALNETGKNSARERLSRHVSPQTQMESQSQDLLPRPEDDQNEKSITKSERLNQEILVKSDKDTITNNSLSPQRVEGKKSKHTHHKDRVQMNTNPISSLRSQAYYSHRISKLDQQTLQRRLHLDVQTEACTFGMGVRGEKSKAAAITERDRIEVKRIVSQTNSLNFPEISQTLLVNQHQLPAKQVTDLQPQNTQTKQTSFADSNQDAQSYYLQQMRQTGYRHVRSLSQHQPTSTFDPIKEFKKNHPETPLRHRQSLASNLENSYVQVRKSAENQCRSDPFSDVHVSCEIKAKKSM